MDEMDKSVHCKVSLSERTVDILCKMAEEDHVSLTTEIENAISGWYRFRHGYTGLATSDPYIIDREIRNLQDELKESNRRASIQLSINEEMEKIRKSIDGSIREQQEGIKDAGKLEL